VRYLALGDSISIDRYTGVRGGGAAAQLAKRLGSRRKDFVDLTRDGETTEGVLRDLERDDLAADVVTVTAGGNDFLTGRPVPAIVANLETIAQRLDRLGATVILNTVYDPTDGDDEVARRRMGIPPEARIGFNAMNQGIRDVAERHGFLLGDLEQLFRGHGIASAEPWFVLEIEPNLAGATATAAHWYGLLRSAGVA
jgi:lysophospholipase L1-like esterase